MAENWYTRAPLRAGDTGAEIELLKPRITIGLCVAFHQRKRIAGGLLCPAWATEEDDLFLILVEADDQLITWGVSAWDLLEPWKVTTWSVNRF